MTFIVIKDTAEREREDAMRRRYEELQALVAAKQSPDPTIVMETTCPTCGRKRYVALGPATSKDT